MKIKDFQLLGIVLIFIILGWILSKKSKVIPMKKPSDQEIKKVLNIITSVYGKSIAENVERIYRLETANFKSEQFLKSYSAGMMAFSDYYPYGWTTLGKEYWNKFNKPVGVVSVGENPGLSGTGGGVKKFVKFASLDDAMLTLAYFLKTHNNNPGRWYSKNPEDQYTYNKTIENINPILT